MKTLKIKNKKVLNKSRKRLAMIMGISLIGIIGVFVIKFTQASTYDGYQRLRVLNVAITEIGNAEWNSRVLSYSEGNRENWCADFVSWVYMTAGYPLNNGAGAGRSSWRIPLVYMQVQGVPNLRDYMSARGVYKTKESGYSPAPGDIVIFARAGRSHTGIVEKYIAGTKNSPALITTIEGNTSTQNVARRSYSINDATIDGYGTIIDAPPVK